MRRDRLWGYHDKWPDRPAARIFKRLHLWALAAGCADEGGDAFTAGLVARFISCGRAVDTPAKSAQL